MAKDIQRPNNAPTITGKEIIIPYFINCKKENLISFVFNIRSHIMPASAPIGVRYAPILEPIIEAKSPYCSELPLKPRKISVKSTLIGMLFKILEDKNESAP